ncbi:MAG: hypothetical protein ACLUE1_01735 [Adlercreutzia equolifaciens]
MQSDPVLFVALTRCAPRRRDRSAAAMLWWVLVRGRLINFHAVARRAAVHGGGAVLLPVAGPAAVPWLLSAPGIAQTLVVMLLWAMLADVAHHSTASPLVIFASGWLAYSLPLPWARRRARSSGS